jgi:hypothetical protein
VSLNSIKYIRNIINFIFHHNLFIFEVGLGGVQVQKKKNEAEKKRRKVKLGQNPVTSPPLKKK